MVINKDTKHVKYEKDWQDNLKWLASGLEKDDQTKLETVKPAISQIVAEQKKLDQEIKVLESKKTGLADIIGRTRRVNQQLTALNTNYTSTETKKKESFLGQATNQYDWETKIKNYYPITYSDNLYEGTINGTAVKITESEAIKLLTRTIKAFEKIEATKFNTKFTASSHTTGTNHLPEIQKLAKDGLKSNEIIGKDSHGQDLPEKGKPANHLWLDRVEYSFKSQFVADTDIKKEVSITAFTPQSTEKIDKTKVDNFFSFIDNLSKDGTLKPEFFTELQADADILKEVENNTVWKIIPAQSTPLKAEELADYGIKVANNDKTKLYLSDSHKKAVKFQIKEGFKSWIELVQAFFPTGSTQASKLASAFATDPYSQLLTDIGNNTHAAHWELPESLDDLQDIADQLELDKISSATTTAELVKEIEQKKKDKQAKESEFTAQNSELTTLLGKIITKKREALNKFQLTDFENKTASGGADNRKTVSELCEIQRLLFQLRYLENDGDATANSSVDTENTALAKTEELIKKWTGNPFSYGWSNIAWVKDKNENPTTEDKIKAIQAEKGKGQSGSFDNWGSLTHFRDALIELEKIIKLDDRQLEAKTKLIAAIEKQSPAENNQEWRETLKVIHADLATVFTDAKITEWKKKKDGQAAFDNTASIIALLEKVCVKQADGTIEKFNDSFISFIKGQDAKLENLSKLIELEEPQKVISLIHQWEFDKLSESEKPKRYLKFAWSEKGGQQEIDHKDKLEAGERDKFNEYLWECAIGKINENSLTKPVKKQEEDDQNKTETPLQWYEKAFYWPVWTVGILIIGGVTAWQWNNWFGKRNEEEGEPVSEKQEDEEE